MEQKQKQKYNKINLNDGIFYCDIIIPFDKLSLTLRMAS